ncbi:MAG: hypothetical protein ACK4YF_06545 [Exilispira sp.]
MKKYFIILLSLTILFAMPTLAKPMVAVTNPILDNGFMLDELSDYEMEI